ncbi:MAG: hypothetical protein JSS20_22460, partial [Proteobacteria bacterium]|nr:hypothetical protein [Pseudomonadota bacterium]
KTAKRAATAKVEAPDVGREIFRAALVQILAEYAANHVQPFWYIAAADEIDGLCREAKAALATRETT